MSLKKIVKIAVWKYSEVIKLFESSQQSKAILQAECIVLVV